MRIINYDSTFYERKTAGSLRAANAVLPHVFKFIQPKSVYDVGCGVGTWLRASKQLGVETVIGIDGSHIGLSGLLIDPSEFRAENLQESRLSLPLKADLAISLEVGEHLREERADSFVEDIAGLSDNILFSAAIPYQGGEGHVNEQFPSYWIPKFAKHGFSCYDFVRTHIWGMKDVPTHYRQNILFYSRLRQFPGHIEAPEYADRVHPEMWLARHGRRGVLRAAVKSMPSAMQDGISFVQRRLTFLGKRTEVPGKP